jgi:hypothetical protein
MLRIAIKYRISEALSAVSGFEVWDFDIKQRRQDDGVWIDIRYRYQPEFKFTATVTLAQTFAVDSDDVVAESDEEIEITIDAVPGAILGRDGCVLVGLDSLYASIEEWVARLEDELLGTVRTQVLSAQQRSLGQLGKHLEQVQNRPIPPARVRTFRERLTRVEDVVVELRSGIEEAESRGEEIRADFERLRELAGVLQERDFLNAVLVRLIKHLWDEENLGLIDGVGRATQALFEDRARGRAVAVAQSSK